MSPKNYISISTFCNVYGIDESFVFELSEYEVLQLKIKNEQAHLSVKDVDVLEKMVRLHQELHINPEGLQVIHQLLQRMERLQEELAVLKRKLNMDLL